MADLDGRMIEVNPAACSLLGERRNADLAAEKDRTYVWIDVTEVAVGDQQ